MTNKGKVLTR